MYADFSCLDVHCNFWGTCSVLRPCLHWEASVFKLTPASYLRPEGAQMVKNLQSSLFVFHPACVLLACNQPFLLAPRRWSVLCSPPSYTDRLTKVDKPYGCCLMHELGTDTLLESRVLQFKE